MTEQADLDHERVADGLLADITAGRYKIGSRIPSTEQLKQQFGVSQTTVRRAVTRLQGEGILEGRPGKGVIVKAMPVEAAADARDLKVLAETVAELKRRTEDYAELREIVYRVEDNLRDLYAKQGFDYPGHGETPPRPDRAVGHG